MTILTMVRLLQCSVYYLPALSMDYLGKVHAVLSICWLVGFSCTPRLLVASIPVVALALLGVMYGVHALMFLAERTGLPVQCFLVFLGA